MTDLRCSLGVTIRARRIELGWTQEELAERISTDEVYVRQSEISRIESGRVTLPRRQRLELLAAALDLPLGELLASSGWAGADQAFEHVPALSLDYRPSHGSTGQFGRQHRLLGRPSVYPSGDVSRPQSVPMTQVAASRGLRLQHIRDATREIQSDLDQINREFRRQFDSSDLVARTS